MSAGVSERFTPHVAHTDPWTDTYTYIKTDRETHTHTQQHTLPVGSSAGIRKQCEAEIPFPEGRGCGVSEGVHLCDCAREVWHRVCFTSL